LHKCSIPLQPITIYNQNFQFSASESFASSIVPKKNNSAYKKVSEFQPQRVKKDETSIFQQPQKEQNTSSLESGSEQ
jgi:hypothetical protein